MSKGIAALFVRRTGALALAIALCSTDAAAAVTPRGPDVIGPRARYQSDPVRHRVWSLNADGLSVRETATSRKVDVPLPGWQWVDAPYACMPDLALAPDGAALVTSNIVPTVWRIDPVTLAVTAHRVALDADTSKDIGFSALVYSPRHGAYFAASDVHGSLWRIDSRLTTANKIALEMPLPRSCGLAVIPPPANDKGALPQLCLRGAEGSVLIRTAGDRGFVRATRARCTERDLAPNVR